MKFQRGSAVQPGMVDEIVYSPNKYRETEGIEGKKKKIDKVLAAKDKFKTGFTKYLQETENATTEKASEVVEEVWTIIENAASYMFQLEPLYGNIYRKHSEPAYAGCRESG